MHKCDSRNYNKLWEMSSILYKTSILANEIFKYKRQKTQCQK